MSGSGEPGAGSENHRPRGLAALYESYRAINPADSNRFWGLTPRLFLIEVFAFHEAARRDAERARSNMWAEERLRRSAKLPDFEEFVRAKRKTVSMSDPVAMADAFAAWKRHLE